MGDKSEKIPVAMNYAQTTSMINNVFSKGRDIYNSAQKVHDKLFRFDGKHISSNIDTYYIIGYNINTIGKVGVEYRNGNYEKLIDIINNLQGDGTVPLISADIGNTVSAEKTYYVIEEHGALPKNNDVIKLVNKIIENDKPVSQKGVISQSNITQDRPTIKHNSRKIRIECPVDVDIYKDGEHMGGIIDNAPYKNDVKSNIGVYSLGDNNDIKIIYIAEENKYDINLTATDDGKMTYTMETLDEFTGDTLKKIRFTDVKLAKGMKIYTDTLEPTYLSIDTNADGNIDKKISPDYDSSITHNIVIKATEGGKILEGKSGEYPKDEILEISAQADKGYKFKGWTSTNGGIFDQENELLTYFLTPNNQTTIIANFEPVDKKTNINQKSNSSRNSENSEKDDRGVSNNENQKEYSSEYFEHTLEKSSYSYVPIYYVNGEAKLIKWSAILNGNLVFFKETEKDIDIKDMKKEFSDIQNHSSKNSIDFVSSREILVGVDKNKFMPNEKVTRATLLSLLARLDNEDLSKYNYIKFKDVKPNSWYSNSVSWAYENNIMSGYGKDKFAPNDIITAEQLAVALYNYMKYKNIELPIDETVQINIENTSSWAREKLKLVYQMGLMSSLKNRFKEKLSRAEISEIFEEFIRVVIKNKALK